MRRLKCESAPECPGRRRRCRKISDDVKSRPKQAERENVEDPTPRALREELDARQIDSQVNEMTPDAAQS